MKRAVLFLAMISLTCSMLHASELKRVEEGKARSLFVEYLENAGRTPEEQAFNLTPFGKTTWLIDCYLKGLQPALPWRHVMDSRGDVRVLDMDSLNITFLNEYSSLPTPQDREGLIQDLVKLHAGERVAIIRSSSDIPGYAGAPLDADMADAVRAPFSFGNLVTVVYTYQQIGGIVRRYRFEFENGTIFRWVRCAVVGRGIGDAQNYE